MVRSLAAGVFEAGSGTLFLLVAIRHFHAGPAVKGILASGSSIGNLISPFLVVLFQSLGFRSSRAASSLMFASALGVLLACFSEKLYLFTLGILFAAATFGSSVPLLAQIYQENYPEHERGRILSRVSMIRIIGAVLAALAGGSLLSGAIEQYTIFLFILASLLAVAGIAMLGVPSLAAVRLNRRELLVGVQALRTEKTFQVSLCGWMLVGLGSFLVLPLRTEYLSNVKYGVNLTEFQVAALVVAIPNLGKLLLYPFWGKMFDKHHFSTVRIVANFTSLFSVLTFFTSNSVLGLVVGSLMQGVALAGGEITWTLWTTRLAEGSRVASLTGIHTFFTGIRGVIGPQLGFHLAEKSSPMVVALTGGMLMLSSIAVFLIEGQMEARLMKEK